MQTITFYAYKGGTGRTLALTKATGFLADEGKRVFVLDLDLEAPGLHFKLLDEAQRSALCPGFVELADHYVHEGYFPPLDGHYMRVSRQPEAKGEILLMPAGRALSGDYWQKLTKLDWQQLFGVEYGQGVPLFLRLKEIIEAECKPDFLLIDARTGVTEVGGAALTLMADAVVCLFSNNEESKWGTREAIRTIGVSTRLPEQQPVRIVPVLARFPPGEPDEQARLEKIRVDMNVERVFVLHSYRELEVNELSALGDETARGGFLKEDYAALFREGLQVELKKLEHEGRIESIGRAAGTDAAVRGWLEMLERPGTTDADIMTALGGLEPELGTGSQYEEVLPQLERIVRRPDTGVEVRATAAQLLALEMARFGRFEAISAEILAAAQTPGPDHPKTLGRLLLLQDIMDEQGGADEPARLRVQDAIIEGLAERLEASDSAARAIELLRSRLHVPDEQGAILALRLRHRLGNLLRRAGDLVAAEAELREAAAGYRFRGEQPAWRRVEEDLARALEAQQRLDEAESLRKRIAKHDRRGRSRPVVPSRPEKRPRTARSGPELCSIAIPLQLVTTLLGGAAETRQIDDVDVIRVPTLRGQLRFWWRALQREGLSSEALYERECHLWGGIGDDEGARSSVELRVEIEETGAIDRSNVLPYGQDATRGAYALWPARESRGRNPQPAAPRRLPGTRFLLQVTCRAVDRRDVEAAIRAWILFGGYGGRTRRGVGSLAIHGGIADRAPWLPADRTREAIRAVFQQDILAPIAARSRNDTPLLAGAILRLGAPKHDAMEAWLTALGWLHEFRQQQPKMGALVNHDPHFARDRGDNRRPSRSNWPEADKVRQLSPLPRGARWAHAPQHNDKPAWPRAGFGLPIVGQFQKRDRQQLAYPPPGEPEDFELRWRDASGPHDRLASPLIVKALALADGGFAPCALWLDRAYPEGGEVILHPRDSRSPDSAAGFDVLVAPGDQARYQWLDRPRSESPGERLRNAFFDWLDRRPEADRTVRKRSP